MTDSDPSYRSDPDVAEVSAGAIPIMVDYAVKCIMSDELRLTLADYVRLSMNDESRDAALLGYRTQVAYAATRNIYEFLLERLYMAKFDLSLMVSTDFGAPPPYVLNALDTLIDSYKQRMVSMEERRKHQKDFASIMAKMNNEN